MNGVRYNYYGPYIEVYSNGYHSPTIGRKYKSRYWLESRHGDLSSDAINFSYGHMKVFLGYILPKKSIFFRVTTLWITINHPVWAWNRNFIPIGRYKKTNTRFLTKYEVFNQLVECSNIKLTCTNYHLKWRFHTVRSNIHQISDSNDLFGPILIFPDRPST